jgi:hypothetical protein
VGLDFVLVATAAIGIIQDWVPAGVLLLYVIRQESLVITQLQAVPTPIPQTHAYNTVDKNLQNPETCHLHYFVGML